MLFANHVEIPTLKVSRYRCDLGSESSVLAPNFHASSAEPRKCVVSNENHTSKGCEQTQFMLYLGFNYSCGHELNWLRTKTILICKVKLWETRSAQSKLAKTVRITAQSMVSETFLHENRALPEKIAEDLFSSPLDLEPLGGDVR